MMGTRQASRAPDVYWFDPTCDRAAGLGSGRSVSGRARELIDDLELLPLFLAGEADVVLVRRRSDPQFERRLAAAGFELPELVSYRGGARGAAAALAGRQLRSLQPWGWSPNGARFACLLETRLPPGRQAGWDPRWRELYSKTWSAGLLRRFLADHPDEARWLCDPAVVGTACASLGEVEAAASGLDPALGERAVVKAAFGTSGRNQVWVPAGPGFRWRDESQRRRVQRLLADYGAAVVEPWLDKVADLSFQIQVAEPGRARLLGICRFLSDDRGQYAGSVVGSPTSGLEPEARRLLDGDGVEPGRLQRLGGVLAETLGGAMAASGYVGPVGIDALLYRAGDGLRLKPVVEVNPRYNMGRIALALAKRVDPRAGARWLIVRLEEIRAAGFADGAALAAQLHDAHPVALGSEGRLTRGLVFTTDWSACRAVVSLLAVGEPAMRAVGALGRSPR
jgi:hypothetical protein